jgi:hypothetical protein
MGASSSVLFHSIISGELLLKDRHVDPCHVFQCCFDNVPMPVKVFDQHHSLRRLCWRRVTALAAGSPIFALDRESEASIEIFR